MTIRSTLTATFAEVAAEQGKTLGNLEDSLVLLDSGLDSLGFAILVTRLEDRLGFDPFTMADEVQFPVTLGDLIGFYEDAGSKAGAPALVG